MSDPKIIYLQADAEENFDVDLGRTWCEDKINDDDVMYIRADLVDDKLRKRLGLRCNN